MSDSELFAQALEPSRIDVVGQNGNDGEHYKYAIQSEFQYGWDFVGTCDDGLRIVFDTMEEAELELLEIIAFTGEDPDGYRAVVYDPDKDDAFARYP